MKKLNILNIEMTIMILSALILCSLYTFLNCHLLPNVRYNLSVFLTTGPTIDMPLPPP